MMNFFKSFRYAFKGIIQSVKIGRNLRLQTVIAAYVLAAAPFFLDSRAEWAVLLLTVALLLCGEIFNTALEHLTDQAADGYSPLARSAKDAAAGAVLVCAVIAVVIGVVLFLRPDRIAAWFFYCQDHLWYPAVLILMLAPSWIFVFKTK